MSANVIIRDIHICPCAEKLSVRVCLRVFVHVSFSVSASARVSVLHAYSAYSSEPMAQLGVKFRAGFKHV
jgi:hypothetical protein